jgi:DNA-binding response OmpR family regulator
MPSSPPPTFHLVLVENDDNDVFFIERALHRAGFRFTVTRLPDGEAAIDYFHRLEAAHDVPDLVLLDIQMPRRNGFEVLQWLRENPAFRRLPVMMLTSSDEPTDQSRARTLGADRFLTKNTDCQEVIDVLQALSRRQ